MPGNQESLNITEAAAFLGAHEQTVRRLARRGGIPAFKVGKDWRFRKEALLRWSEDQQRGGRRCSVLVIDDDEMVRRAMGKMLTRFGCRVQQANGGKEGLERVAQEVPDVILLDLMMPNLNGPEFLEELRKTQPKLPVVIVTGYPNGELMQEAAKFAPVMLLAKPVEKDLLERTVRIAVGEKMALLARPAAHETVPISANTGASP
jgi:excisionase family DNA binding protein